MCPSSDCGLDWLCDEATGAVTYTAQLKKRQNVKTRRLLVFRIPRYRYNMTLASSPLPLAHSVWSSPSRRRSSALIKVLRLLTDSRNFHHQAWGSTLQQSSTDLSTDLGFIPKMQRNSHQQSRPRHLCQPINRSCGHADHRHRVSCLLLDPYGFCCVASWTRNLTNTYRTRISSFNRWVISFSYSRTDLILMTK